MRSLGGKESHQTDKLLFARSLNDICENKTILCLHQKIPLPDGQGKDTTYF